ncbi:MAG: protease modulator HflC [Thermoanaerobaculia bacterium]
MKKSTVLLLILAALLVLLAPTAVFTIRETEVGIVTRFGRPLDKLAEPGLNFKRPWPIDDVVRVDKRLLVFDNEPAEMLTRDKKNVLVDSFLCWRIKDPLLFVQTVKTRAEAEARLLDFTASELGAAVGSEPMDAFLNADPERVRLRQVAERARSQVHELALASFGIEVVDLEINGFNLPRQNRRSVIERMRAERARIATRYRSEGEEAALKIEALSAAEREKILAEARAEAEATRGRGEAEALKLLAEAYREDPEFYRFLRSLESYEKIIDENTTLFIESDSALMEALLGR